MRYRRKAVEVEVERCDLDYHVDGRIVDPEEFEREYEPVPGHDTSDPRECLRAEARHAAALESLELADKLAEASNEAKRVLMGLVDAIAQEHTSIDEWAYGVVAASRESDAVLRRVVPALSAYLDSRKEKR